MRIAGDSAIFLHKDDDITVRRQQVHQVVENMLASLTPHLGKSVNLTIMWDAGDGQ